MAAVLLVFVGGGLGAAVRHLINVGFMRLSLGDVPYATMLINVTGSLLMGLIAGWFAFRNVDPFNQNLRLLLTTGVLGGYTTFSTFSLDAALLWERGNIAGMALYVGGSVLLSIIALFAGLWLVRAAG
jgi:CrcB protein